MNYKFSLFTCRQLGWRCLAWSCLGLGTVGVFVPLLPTTPFILLAAWIAPRGSEQLDHWLQHHPRFGPLLLAWRKEHSLPRYAKWLAIVMLTMSWMLLWQLGTAKSVLLLLALVFCLVSGYLLTCPDNHRIKP